jgi:alpha-galactosidase
VYPEARVVREHPEYFVKNKDGSFLRARSFGHDCYVLCPSYPPGRAFMRRVCEKLAGEYGFDGVKDDGHKVPSPCYNPVHQHAYPEESVEDYPLMIKEVYETFARLKPESFVVAFCFDGVVPYFYHHHHTTRPWTNGDQKSEQQARWKQKLYKAIFGPRRVLLDDHSDVKYLTGSRGTWYLGPISGLAMGSVLETAIAEGYDYQSHGYDKIFAAYHREKLPEGGEYLNLYDVAHDKPEGHVVRKGDSMYYGFFAESHQGTLELRGLEDGGRYRVVDYLNGVKYPDLVAEGTTGEIDVSFDSYLLLRLEKQ